MSERQRRYITIFDVIWITGVAMSAAMMTRFEMRKLGPSDQDVAFFVGIGAFIANCALILGVLYLTTQALSRLSRRK